MLLTVSVNPTLTGLYLLCICVFVAIQWCSWPLSLILRPQHPPVIVRSPLAATWMLFSALDNAANHCGALYSTMNSHLYSSRDMLQFLLHTHTQREPPKCWPPAACRARHTKSKFRGSTWSSAAASSLCVLRAWVSATGPGQHHGNFYFCLWVGRGSRRRSDTPVAYSKGGGASANGFTLLCVSRWQTAFLSPATLPQSGRSRSSSIKPRRSCVKKKKRKTTLLLPFMLGKSCSIKWGRHQTSVHVCVCVWVCVSLMHCLHTAQYSTVLWLYIIPNAAAVIGAVMWLLSKCSLPGLNWNGQDYFLAGWLVGWALVLLLLRANMTHTQRHTRTW